MKKYKLTNETIVHLGITLYRIEALMDFSDVKTGDKGGFVQSENNLSQLGNAWVYGDAKVRGNASVRGYAKVYGNAEVYDNASVRGYAKVFDNAEVYDNAKVYGYAKVCGNAEVYDNAFVCGNANVFGDAEVCGNASVYGKAFVCDYVKVRGDADVYGKAEVRGDAKVYKNSDYIVFKNWWSSGRYFTWTRSNNMWKVGCFYGNGEELIKKAYADSEESGREYERVVRYVENILADELNK